jgi:hypothetical protein
MKGAKTKNLQGDPTRAMMFDPGLPYIYIPNEDFTLLAGAISEEDRTIHCESHAASNFCKWNSPCSQVVDAGWTLNYNVFDSTGVQNSYTIPMSQKAYAQNYIPGNLVGDSVDTCYLPIFKSMYGDQNTWYAGASFMSWFYLSYDMTPFDEQNQ